MHMKPRMKTPPVRQAGSGSLLRRPLLMLTALSALAWQGAAGAANTMWSDAAIKAMPPYCEARYGKDPVLYNRWKQVIGPGFMHTHHLCDGFGYLNRYAQETMPRKKMEALSSAMGTLNYVLRHVGPDYPLMPEVYLARGQVYAYQKKQGEALQDFLKAIELDPKQVRAYVLAADLLAKMDKKDQALQLVTDGLRRNPGDQGLQRGYDKLGGRPPYPEPKKKTETPFGEANQAAEKPAPAPVPARTAVEGPPAGLPEAAPVTAAQPAPQEQKMQTAVPATPVPIGSPSNPWCRFCPEPAK